MGVTQQKFTVVPLPAGYPRPIHRDLPRSPDSIAITAITAITTAAPCRLLRFSPVSDQFQRVSTQFPSVSIEFCSVSNRFAPV
jgi:hypothetical protein